MIPNSPLDSMSATDVLRARMFEQRVVLVNDALDDALAGRVATELMMLDASGDSAVRLLLNSSDGTLSGAFTLIDVIDLLGVPVHATCIGRAEGPALGVLAVAARRHAIPHARLRLCEPREAFSGRADDIASWAARRDTDLERFCARLAEATRRPAPWIADAMREGRVFDVAEAIRTGLLDGVAPPGAAPVQHLDGRPIGFRSRRTPIG